MGISTFSIAIAVAVSFVVLEPTASITVSPANPVLEPAPVAEARVDRENDAEYDEAEDYRDDPADEDQSGEMYASEYPYGQPMEKFKMEERAGQASSRKGRAHVRIVHKYAGKPRNYAKKYRTWMPSKEFIKPTRSRKGPKRLGPPMKRRKPGRRRFSNSPNGRRPVNPIRNNHLQRPTPPPEPEYDYFSEEEYFPEEAKRNEYYNERRPSNNRNQGMRRKPGRGSNSDRVKPTDDYPSVSYSNFIHHSGSSTSSSWDYDDFPDEPRPQKKEKRRKKKKRKGDRNRVRDRGEDQYGAHTEAVEDAKIKNYEKYPPYPEDPPLRRPLRQPQQSFETTQPTPIYGDGYLGNQVNTQRQPQNVNINRVNPDPGLSRFRNDINSGGVQTFTHQNYAPNNYNNFGVSNNSPQPDIITQQNYNQFVNQGFGNNVNSQQYVPQPNHITPTYNSQGIINHNNPINFNQNPVLQRPQQITNAHTLQNVIPANRGNEYSSKYKSNSFFDNTETFHDFNQNVNYNQEAKHRHSFVPSTEYREPQQVNPDDDFINRHLDLYSNGVKGVPVQGGGRQESRTKDYDIGYGELQYDESHRS